MVAARSRAGWQGAGAAGRAAVVLGLCTLALLSCASPGMPPGGPPDNDVPVIRRITPDTNAVNVDAREVLIFFDEVIAERPGAAGQGGGGFGGGDLSSIVSISPSDGRDEVTWRRTAIEIRPRRGFRPNTAYRVTVQPGIADLRGNVLPTGIEFVFSTGPSIPTGEVRGAVFDWAQARPAALARVEVYPPEDSTFRWSARADSAGRYVIRDLTPGTYRLRAWIDANNDRRVGLGEAVDTATIEFEQATSAVLYAFPRDTLAPRLDRVTPVDSTALTLRFDRVVAGDWDPAGAVSLVGADSSEIALGGPLLPAARFDSLARPQAEGGDAAADSSLSPDSLDTQRARADSILGEAAAAAAAAPVSDTTAQAEPAPSFDRIRPVQEWKVRLAAPLAPGTYRVRITGAPGLNGIARPSDRSFTVREPEPPKETPADTTVTPPALRAPDR